MLSICICGHHPEFFVASRNVTHFCCSSELWFPSPQYPGLRVTIGISNEAVEFVSSSSAPIDTPPSPTSKFQGLFVREGPRSPLLAIIGTRSRTYHGALRVRRRMINRQERSKPVDRVDGTQKSLENPDRKSAGRCRSSGPLFLDRSFLPSMRRWVGTIDNGCILGSPALI